MKWLIIKLRTKWFMNHWHFGEEASKYMANLKYEKLTNFEDKISELLDVIQDLND